MVVACIKKEKMIVACILATHPLAKLTPMPTKAPCGQLISSRDEFAHASARACRDPGKSWKLDGQVI